MNTTTHDVEAATPTRASAAGRRSEGAGEEYDLLIATALGAVVGAGLMLLLRARPRKRSRAALIAEAARKRAAQLRRLGAKRMRHAASGAASRSEAILDQLPVEEVRDTIGEYVDTARRAIDEAVTEEMRALRKAIRRQRKRLGV